MAADEALAASGEETHGPGGTCQAGVTVQWRGREALTRSSLAPRSPKTTEGRVWRRAEADRANAWRCPSMALFFPPLSREEHPVGLSPQEWSLSRCLGEGTCVSGICAAMGLKGFEGR